MGKITFKHTDCNGWAIYDSQYIDAEEAKNIHVVECKITVDENGKKTFVPNRQLETVCQVKLKKYISRKCIDFSTEPSEIRLKLTKLQNEGKEVCGTCVSHFYADPKA